MRASLSLNSARVRAYFKFALRASIAHALGFVLCLICRLIEFEATYVRGLNKEAKKEREQETARCGRKEGRRGSKSDLGCARPGGGSLLHWFAR